MCVCSWLCRHLCGMIFMKCYYTTLTKPSLFLSSLQLQNLLYSPEGVIKVADFGLARCFVPGQRLQGKIGTLSLMAPEILRGGKYEGPPVDVWATGVVLHYMFTKKYPFSKKELRVSIYTFPLIIIFIITLMNVVN